MLTLRKRISLNFITLSTCLLFTGNVFANNTETGIEVRGQASVLVAPNSYVLSIAISEQGRFTDKIRSIVDNKSNQIVDVAKNIGVKSTDINSARVSLRVLTEEQRIKTQGVEVSHQLPNQQKSKIYIDGIDNNQNVNRHPQYFEISRMITVKFSDIKDYDQFLNSIVKLGVSHISPLTMSVDDTDQYYQQALLLAMDKAKEKATKIAQQSEQKLGKIVYVKETSSNHYRTRYNSVMSSASGNFEHNSQTGNQAINASVSVKYSIE